MSYGSNNWHRQIGRANIEAEQNHAAAQHHKEMDEKALESLEEGMAATAPAGNGETVTGFILEIMDRKVTVENWNNSVTVDARKVTVEE